MLQLNKWINVWTVYNSKQSKGWQDNSKTWNLTQLYQKSLGSTGKTPLKTGKTKSLLGKLGHDLVNSL